MSRSSSAVLAAMLALGAAAQETSQSGLELKAPRPLVSQAERAPKAMVATTHEAATQTGLDILRRGGNAVDAAVAIAFVLAVVHPEAGNLGGGGYMLVRMADGRTSAIDYKETVPAAATRDAFPRGQRTVGYRAAGVPGTVAGMEVAHRQFGRLKWKHVLDPARRLAENGVPASQRMELILPLQVPVMKPFPESARLFLHGTDQPLKQGEILRQRDLAATIRRIQKSGARDFYTGETAKRIAADMSANMGFLNAQDLASYRAIETKPLVTTYRGHPLLTVPPSSSGGMTVVEALNVLEHFSMPLGREGSSQSWHYIVEALRRAARDRLYHAGDPSFDKVPSARLTSKEYAAELARTVLADRATPQPQFPQVAAASPSLIDESTSTTHFSVLDGEGNMVANTYTLGSFYGAQVVVRGTGVLLGDMVATLATGVPVGGRDPIRGGRRMASTMSPVLLLRPDGSPWAALGTPGAATIPSTLVQVIVNLIDFKMSLRDAIEYPRLHHQFMPDRIDAEPAALVFDVAERLRAMGHVIEPKLRSQGDVHAVMIEEKTGMRLGWSDGRRGGRAAGY